jgi:hypothetical protein
VQLTSAGSGVGRFSGAASAVGMLVALLSGPADEGSSVGAAAGLSLPPPTPNTTKTPTTTTTTAAIAVMVIPRFRRCRRRSASRSACRLAFRCASCC